MSISVATETYPSDQLVADLRRRIAGPVHLAGDPAYDIQRATYAGHLDARPAVIVEAETSIDIQDAVRAAREHEVPLAVQSTGHGTLVPSDGGLLLKTGRMHQVIVDPSRQVARVGPGARWSDVIAAAAPYDLAPLSGDSPQVGVVGYTLGGGLSWLSRAYGFAADSLVRVGLVTADGRLLNVSRRSHPDLFWAIRGGSGNFGVVTGLDIRLFPVDQVHAGTSYVSIDRAADVLQHVAAHGQAAPDALTQTVVIMNQAPVSIPVDGPVVAVRSVYAGDASGAERALRPLRGVAGPLIADDVRRMTYAEVATIGGTPPLGFELYDALSDDLIQTAIDAVTRTDEPATALDFRTWGGVMAHPQVDRPGPTGHRTVPYSITMHAPPDVVRALAAHAGGGSFLNFLGDTRRTREAFTAENWQGLRHVKSDYDPDNVFRLNHNVAPIG